MPVSGKKFRILEKNDKKRQILDGIGDFLWTLARISTLVGCLCFLAYFFGYIFFLDKKKYPTLSSA